MTMADDSHLRPGVKIGSFILDKDIGSGAFASVWRAKHDRSGTPVAIKVINKSTISTPVARTRLQREIALLKKMNHPFIAEFFHVSEDDVSFYLVMEYAENGNLLDYVNNNGRLSEDQARRYFAQLISVLEYLHVEKKVAHRDLKCENVLLDRYNNIRVIDFGLSNMFSDVCPQLNTACGSPAYAAPEMVKGNAYTQAADIWSSGILLYAITVGHLPYDDDNLQRLLQKIVYTEVFYPSFLSPPRVDLLQKMICKDPDQRITLDKIKAHPWFSQTEYYALLKQSSSLGQGRWETLEGQQEDGIDKEIIDKITAMGVDCHELHNSLLVGEFTELTALYRLLQRQKTTENMKDIMQHLSQAHGRMQAVPMRSLTLKQVAGPPHCGEEALAPLEKRQTFMPKAVRMVPLGRPSFAHPGQPGQPGPRLLTSPILNNSGTRRLSRPVAVRRPVGQHPAGAAAGSHETP